MRKKIRQVVKDVGLLPLVDWLIKNISIHNAKQVFKSFKFYIFNKILTNFPNFPLRASYLRNILGIKIGKDTYIHMGCFFEGGEISIGRNSVVGRNCYLGGGKLIIGNNVSITAQTYIFCTSHHKDSSTFEAYSKDVVIKDRVWVGARAMILPGVTIHEGAILGANSTATKNIPAYSVYVGSPAKIIGKRKKNLIYELNYFPYFQ